ncbi:hypothetical protein L228DRAFT_124332 [Xylona heveae TC161]|uniref:Nucleotide exchange factor SIL1 n=1 Tax=Xylona heveae (strain CBS 132557 / TC161) TaxID=1328760 RepID=A0A161TD96_XYLHT|nr:hypothetical protein L228DRAFT_124332 [Xylona heveae TC161]KZF23797.1 hypothetical protein L228DRAFT_124332 [Xylona heveae TC161]
MRLSSSLSILSLLLFASFSNASSQEPSVHSGKASDNDIICHPSPEGAVPTCYPRVFQPTEDFQTIHDDQHIPAGIHLRMNLETGKKEGRINTDMDADPSSDQDGVVRMTLDESTNNRAVAVIANEDDDYESGIGSGAEQIQPVLGQVHKDEQHKSMLEKSGKKPPSYSNDGKIKPAPPESEEHDIFNVAVETVLGETKTVESSLPLSSSSSSPSSSSSAYSDDHLIPEGENIMSALDQLEELAHSIYWGHRLLSSQDTVFSLLTLMQSSPDANIRANAALVLGSAVQNNPAGLTALVNHFGNVSHESSSTSSSGSSYSSYTSTSSNPTVQLLSFLLDALSAEKDTKVAEKIVYFLSSLSRGSGVLASSPFFSSSTSSSFSSSSSSPSSDASDSSDSSFSESSFSSSSESSSSYSSSSSSSDTEDPSLSPETLSILNRLLPIFDAAHTRPDDGRERLRGRISTFVNDVVEALVEAQPRLTELSETAETAEAVDDTEPAILVPSISSPDEQDKVLYEWCHALQTAYTSYLSPSESELESESQRHEASGAGEAAGKNVFRFKQNDERTTSLPMARLTEGIKALRGYCPVDLHTLS